MKRTLIAAAILASAAVSSAYAAPSKVYLFNTTGVDERIDIDGRVLLFGCVDVTSTAGAVIKNNQSVNLNGSRLDPNYQSYTKGSVTTTVSAERLHVAASASASSTYNDSYSNNTFHTDSASSSSQHDSTYWTKTFTHDLDTSKSSSSNHTKSSSSDSQSSSGYKVFVFDDGGVSWNQASSGQSATEKSSSSSSSSSNESSDLDFRWSQHHDDSSSSSSHTRSSTTTSDTRYSTSATATRNVDVDAVDVTVRGSVTVVTDTRKPGVLNASTGVNAASGVTGNLGVNIAEGIDNAQSNDVALASVDIGNVFGNAQIFSNQSSSGKATINNFKLNAWIGDGSLSNVSGNVGVNVASGIGNVQNNSLAGAVTTVNPANVGTVAMVATDDNVQSAAASVKGRFEGDAHLGANTLHGSTGNIGVNIAGGAGNLQHNGLAIAALNNGH